MARAGASWPGQEHHGRVRSMGQEPRSMGQEPRSMDMEPGRVQDGILGWSRTGILGWSRTGTLGVPGPCHPGYTPPCHAAPLHLPYAQLLAKCAMGS